MKRLAVLAFLLALTFTGFGQNIKTQVLVVGETDAAVAAALQAAISGVKTTLLSKKETFTIKGIDQKTASGLEAALYQRIRLAKGIKDSITAVTLDPVITNQVLKEWMDSTKNLTVIQNASWTRFERSGMGWQVRLNDGKNIKANVLVYGTTEDISSAIKYAATTVGVPLDYSKDLYRTSVAGYVGEAGPMIVSQYALIPANEDNMVIANATDANMATGQAAGVIASYGPFFGVKTSLTKLKVAQGEVLAYKQTIMPVSDVSVYDTNWRAIQNLLQTGIIKTALGTSGSMFFPEQAINIQELRQPIRDYFYKAQIWFEDHEKATGTLDEIAHLIAYTRLKSVESMLEEIQKKWKTSYKFANNFDAKRVLTRREFAAIAYDYFQLDQVNVDRTGKVIR